MPRPERPPTALRIVEEIPVPGNQTHVETRSRGMDVGVWFDDTRADDAHYWLYFTRVWYFARVWAGPERIAAGWDGHLVEVVPPRRRPPAGFNGAEIHHYLFELEGHGLFELLAEDWCSSLTDPEADSTSRAEAVPDARWAEAAPGGHRPEDTPETGWADDTPETGWAEADDFAPAADPAEPGVDRAQPVAVPVGSRP